MRKRLIACLIISLIVIMLIEPTLCIEGATTGLLLWFQKVLPSLLPFIILINLLCFLGIIFKLSLPIHTVTKKLFGLSGSSFIIFILGLISGYPMGAKLTKNLLHSNEISYEEAQKNLCFVCNCGPLFIVGTIGTLMLGNPHIGYFLLLIHVLSAFIMLLLSRFYKVSSLKRISSPIQTSSKMNFSIAFTSAIQNGMDTIVYVGGYIIFFSMLINLLAHSPIYKHFIAILSFLIHIDSISIQTFFLSLLEFSSGSALLVHTFSKSPILLALISALVAFGGICVLFQTQYVLQDSNLSIIPYLYAKILQAILAFLLTFTILPIWNHFSLLIPINFSFIWFILLIIHIFLISLFYNILNKTQNN